MIRKFKICYTVEVETDEGKDDSGGPNDYSRVWVSENLYDTMTGDSYSSWEEYWRHQTSRDSSFGINENKIEAEEI